MAKRRPKQTDMRDWRTITDEREKYAAYLCSREWAVKKNAVHERAKGTCERCGLLPISAVHHLTYERKYREELTDLAGWCQPCHDFTHGKSNYDPSDIRIKVVVNYAKRCIAKGKPPCPFELTDYIDAKYSLKPRLLWPVVAIDEMIFRQKMVSDIETSRSASSMLCDLIADKIDELLPFDYSMFARTFGMRSVEPSAYTCVLGWLGLECRGDYFRSRDSDGECEPDEWME